MKTRILRIVSAVFLGMFLMFSTSRVVAQHTDKLKEQTENQVKELSSLYDTLRSDRWADDNGRPTGVPAEYWKVISPDVGVIWVPQGGQATDQAILALKVGAQWHAVDPVGIREFWYLKK